MFHKLFLTLFFTLILAVSCEAAEPQDCLAAIARALDSGDVQAFERKVAVDEILATALDSFLEEAKNPEVAEELPPMLTLMLSQAVAQEPIRKLLLQEARNFILSGVSTGAFAGKKLDSAQTQGLLAPLFANASIGRKEIIFYGDGVSDDENGYLMPFTVRDHGNGHDYAVVGHFRPAPDGMRLTSIENLDEIFAKLRQEAKER